MAAVVLGETRLVFLGFSKELQVSWKCWGETAKELCVNEQSVKFWVNEVNLGWCTQHVKRLHFPPTLDCFIAFCRSIQLWSTKKPQFRIHKVHSSSSPVNSFQVHAHRCKQITLICRASVFKSATAYVHFDVLINALDANPDFSMRH